MSTSATLQVPSGRSGRRQGAHERDHPRTGRRLPSRFWEPYTATLGSTGGGLGSGFGVGHDQLDDTAELDAHLLERAQRTAEEGARRLRAAGMGADPLVEERDGSIARTVLAVAERVNAEAVVVGTRGRGEAMSALLGSVSHDLVQHADRAVVVVPSAALARHRDGWLPQVP